MAMPSKLVPIRIEDYLAFEERTPLKHEYVDGRIYAMTGAQRRHNLIVSRLLCRARLAADARPPCQVFASDMKLYVQPRNSIYYPDIVACCDPDDREEIYVIRPCFIVEVLSPSTTGIDRREKRMSYETLPSLREYLIVSQDRMRVELYQREEAGWQGYLLRQPDDLIWSSCLQLRMTLAELYADVELPPPGVAEEAPPEYA